MQCYILECFAKAKLIGNEIYCYKVKKYRNQLLKHYICEQIRYFPNSMKTIDNYIIMAGIIFDNAIVDNDVAMIDMSPVQYPILAQLLKQEMIDNRKK